MTSLDIGIRLLDEVHATLEHFLHRYVVLQVQKSVCDRVATVIPPHHDIFLHNFLDETSLMLPDRIPSILNFRREIS